MAYEVEMIERSTGKVHRLELRESACGSRWVNEAGEDLPHDPQPTLAAARRLLEREYLYTHEIVWPLVPTSRGVKPPNDTIFAIRLPTPLLWELKLLAGMSAKDVSTMIRLIVTDYIRPGTLPPIEQHVANIAGDLYREKQLSTKDNRQ